MKDLILMYVQGDQLELDELKQVEAKLLELSHALKDTGVLFMPTSITVNIELARVQKEIAVYHPK